MRAHRPATLATLILLAAAARPALANDALAPEPARPADGLVETMGVATHFGFHNTVYHQKFDEVQRRLGELGVRYIRDGLDPHLNELWRLHGIRGILVTEPIRTWEQWTTLWHSNRAVIAAIEGPNEANGGWTKFHGSYQGQGWPEGVRLFQNDLYKTVKGDPRLKDIPVIAVSTAYKGFGRELAPLRSFDLANAHSYAGGAMPSRSLDFVDPYLLLGRGAVCPPLAATESGYHTCLGSTKVIAAAQQGISHAAHRKYMPRHFAEYFNAGLVWTVSYEFAAGRPKKAEQEDPEAAFGLLMPDASPKPAFFALKDLIAALAESRWDAAAGQWVRPAPFAPRALAFALRGAPASVHHTLLQRADGSFQLLVWNEVPSFDLKRRRDIANPAVPVKLVLDRTATSISVARLGPDAPPAARTESVRELDLQVPDEVLVVGITLAEPLRPAPLAPPSGIETTSTPTAVELAWPSAPGAAAYWVSLNGRQLGQAQAGPDGKARLCATGLIPATTYPFEIVAAARDGGVSAPARVLATTVDAFPDLAVRSLKTEPEAPKDGEPVKFIAVIENCGKAGVETGVTIGTKFQVDGKTVAWCDNLRGPLAPGQRVEVRPNSGPRGPAPWTMTHGMHQVTALADDVNRIIESDESNNRMTITVGSGTGPDLVVREANVRQAKAQAGQPVAQPVVVDVTVANQGTEPVPAGTHIGVSVYNVDAKPRVNLGYDISLQGIPVGGTLALTVTCQPSLPAGKHALAVVVDDVNRIPELNKSNNATNFEIEVGAPSAAAPKPAAPAKPEVRTPTTASTVPEKAAMPRRGLNRESQIRKAVQGHHPRLIFVGDSITEFYDKEVLARNYGTYDGVWFGFSGENTEHILGHIADGILDGQEPKVIVLLIGTNNLGHNPSEKPEWVAAGIRAIVDALHQKLPNARVLVMGIFPRGRLPQDPIRARVAAVNKLISTLDDGQKTRYLDIGSKFMTPDGTIPKDLMGDMLHPTAKGEQLWADSIQPLLDEMMK